MNLFYENLPDSIMVDGEAYKVLTDFREWIRFSDMLEADIDDKLKSQFIREMFLEDPPDTNSIESIKALFSGIVEFIKMETLDVPKDEDNESIEENREEPKASLSYTYDAPYIVSAFQRDYNIDILNIEYMHWWKFKMLFNDLSDTNEIKKRIYYRTVDIGSIKDQKERMRIMKIRQLIDLPENKTVSDGDIGNAFM